MYMCKPLCSVDLNECVFPKHVMGLSVDIDVQLHMHVHVHVHVGM